MPKPKPTPTPTPESNNPGQPSAGAASTHDTEQTTSRVDAYVADHLVVDLPPHISFKGHLPLKAETPESPEQVLTPEEAVTQAQELQRKALLSDGRLVPVAVRETLGFFLLREGLDLQATKEDLPFNHKQVPAAGRAVVNTIDTVEEAKVMAGSVVGMEDDLAMLERINRLAEPIEMAYEVLQANRTKVLNRISQKSLAALGRAKSLLDNPLMSRGLADAVAVRQEPATQGVQTRGEHGKLVAATTSAVKAAEAQTTAQDKGAAAQTTTTTTMPVATAAPPAGKPPRNKAG